MTPFRNTASSACKFTEAVSPKRATSRSRSRCCREEQLRCFIVFRRVEIQIEARIVDLNKLDFSRTREEKFLEARSVGIREGFKRNAGQKDRMPRPASPRGLANGFTMSCAE